MEQKLIVCIMGQDCQRFIKMCLKSVKNADKIIYCDGGSSNEFWEYFNKVKSELGLDIEVIENKYDQEDKGMNGKQRNFYLKYLKDNYPNDWCLCLDADEVVGDLSKISDFIKKCDSGLYSVKMRHFIGDLGHEDSINEVHFVPNRLFKIMSADEYPEVEHPVLKPKEKELQGYLTEAIIWHLAYIPNLWEIKKRYENHLKKSNMHTPEFLKNWYYSHLFGQYPRNQIDIIDIPEIILNEFGIDKDEIYFANRNLEVKHFVMMRQWLDYIHKEIQGRIDLIEFGCGKAPFGYAFKIIEGNWPEYLGIELSNFAVNNSFVPIVKGDIINYKIGKDGIIHPEFAVCLCLDILEHLTKEELNKALENIKDCAKYFIFSIPFIGDPNLEADKTHKIKETKEWWINKLSEYFNIKEAPKEWLYSSQLLIGEIKWK
jgi:hypothetical protein